MSQSAELCTTGSATLMIDLHFHLLPAIDDGARSVDETVEMCRIAQRDGCVALVATPHQRHARWANDDPAELNALLDNVRERLGPAPELHLGAEIRVGTEFLNAIDDPVSDGFVPLAGSRYLLLELSRSGQNVAPEELTHELRLAGWFPIFAHPEFIPDLVNDLDLMQRMVNGGAHFQVTAMGLTGEFGRRARNAIAEMIDRDLVDFVASDAHRTDWRPPGLAAARQLIAARWGEDTAHRLTYLHPLAVLNDTPLDAPVHAADAKPTVVWSAR